jgi:hypothetical protein
MVTSALAGLSALLLVAAVAGAAAPSTSSPTTTLYRWVDSDGIVHYSDRPQPGAQVIHIQGAQTYSAPPAPKTDVSKSSGPLEPSLYQSCAIVEPGQESTFANPENVPISVRISPALRPGDQLEVSVDGAVLQPVGGGLQYQITAPERGAHTVTAAVRDADGKAVCQAASVTFSVQRTSLLSPQSPLRPH